MNEEVQAAIKERISLGLSKEEVVAELKAAGYPPELANELYEQTLAEKLPTQAIPPKVSEEKFEPDPEVSSVNQTEPNQSHPPAKTKKAKTSFALIFTLLALSLTLVGLSVYAYFSGFSPQSLLGGGAPYSTEADLIEGILINSEAMTAYGFNADLGFVLEPREPDTPVFNPDQVTFFEARDAANLIRSGVDDGYFSVSASGLVDFRDVENPSFDITAQLDALMQPVAINLAGSARLVDKTIYGKMDTIPGIFKQFIDNVPEGEWISIYNTENMQLDNNPTNLQVPLIQLPDGMPELAKVMIPDASSVYLDNFLNLISFHQQTIQQVTIDTASQLASGAAALQLNSDLSAADRESLEAALATLKEYPPFVFVGEPVKIEANGETIFRYEVDLDYDNILAANAEQTLDTDDGFRSVRQSPPSREEIAEFNRLTKLFVDVRDDGSSAGAALEMLMTLDDPGVESQIIIEASIFYTPQNNALSISAPKEVHDKTLEEIFRQNLQTQIMQAEVRANDASTRQALGNAMMQAEIAYNENNFTYAGTCEAAAIDDGLDFLAQLNGHDFVVGETPQVDTVTCNDSDTAYFLTAPSATEVDSLLCVDSNGFFGTVAVTDFTNSADITCGTTGVEFELGTGIN